MKINKGTIFVLSAGIMWGAAGIFVRALSAATVTEMNIVLFRALFSVIMLGGIMLLVNKKYFYIKLRDIIYFASCGIFSIVMFNYCYYRTMKLTSLSVAAVLLYTAPIFVMIISVFLFGEKVTFKKIIACITAFLGCFFVSGVIGSMGAISTEGLIFGLLTGFGYSLYTVFGNILIKKGYNSFTVTFYTFLFAFLGALPLSDIKGAVKMFSDIRFVPEKVRIFGGFPVIAIAVLMALFNTVIPYIIYTAGLKNISPSAAPIIATVEPVVATVVGILLFGEKLTLFSVFGILLVLGSVVILNFGVGKNENKGICQNKSDS